MEQYVDKITQMPTPNHLYPRDKLSLAREFERKLIFRCVNDVRRVVFLWEDTRHWQVNGDQQSQGTDYAEVQKSGWAVISPLTGHSAEVCAAHSGFSIYIQSVDDSDLKASDGIADCVVQSMRALHLSRNAFLENVFLDKYLEQARKCQ